MPTDAFGWAFVFGVTAVILALLLLTLALSRLPLTDHEASMSTGDQFDKSDAWVGIAVAIVLIIGIGAIIGNFVEESKQSERQTRQMSGELLRTREALTVMNLKYTELQVRMQEVLGKLNEPPPYCAPVAPSTPVPVVPRFGADSQFHISGRMEGHGVR